MFYEKLAQAKRDKDRLTPYELAALGAGGGGVTLLGADQLAKRSEGFRDFLARKDHYDKALSQAIESMPISTDNAMTNRLNASKLKDEFKQKRVNAARLSLGGLATLGGIATMYGAHRYYNQRKRRKD